MTVDQEGFENEMEKQRERARAARQDVDSMQVQGGVLGEVKVASEFVGYGTVATESNVVALVKTVSTQIAYKRGRRTVNS